MLAALLVIYALSYLALYLLDADSNLRLLLMAILITCTAPGYVHMLINTRGPELSISRALQLIRVPESRIARKHTLVGAIVMFVGLHPLALGIAGLQQTDQVLIYGVITLIGIGTTCIGSYWFADFAIFNYSKTATSPSRNH
jgi:hypothetical protein